METSKRIKNLPPYLFVSISKAIEEKREQGIDVISFGIGDPDIPTPPELIDILTVASRDAVNHRYPESEGLLRFRQAVADFYGRRFSVSLDPKTEIINLIGAKEGIAHMALCIADPGDIILTTDPSYPVYDLGTMFAGGVTHKVKLYEKNHWLIDFGDIPTAIARNAKAMWLNYPNNPTGGCADIDFFRDAVQFALQFDIILLHDVCYSEITYDGYIAPSILQVEDARDITVEFHSLSKTANMTGWRVGMAAGNSTLINALMRVKSNIDSGLPQALQEMGIAALSLPQSFIDSNRSIYRRRRDKITATLNEIGLRAPVPKAGLYLWVPIPERYTSAEFTQFLLEEVNVVVTPGSGYGAAGEGYIRLSLTIPDDELDEGLRRLRSLASSSRWR